MRFLAAPWLLLLLGVAALVVVYVLAQARKDRYTVRFTNLELLGSVAPQHPGWRRHAIAGVFAVALVLLVVALAQPARNVQEPREQATIVLAFDTSLSMGADDVEPDRLEAAQRAATQFADGLPDTFNVGLVTFDGTARVAVSPTTDRAVLTNAVDQLELGEGTAIGEGIFSSLQAIEDLPVADGGEPPPSSIVLLSDGETTVGRPDAQAAEAAAEAGVPVTTIAFGTPNGVIEVEIDGITQQIPVPVAEDALDDVASATDGGAFSAQTGGQLDAVYEEIASQIGFVTVPKDISRWFLGIGVLGLVVCAGLSLAWTNRIL